MPQVIQTFLERKAIFDYLPMILIVSIILAVTIDLAFLKLHDLTPKDPSSGSILFIFVSTIFIVAQIFLLKYIKQQDIEFVRTKQFRVIRFAVTGVQWVLTILVLYVIFQIWMKSSFDIGPILLGITISYSLGIMMTGFLSYRLFIWLRSTHRMTILLYMLSSGSITVSAIFTAVFLDSVSALYTTVVPRISGTGLYLTPFQDTLLLLANIFAIASFIITWLATAVLLKHRSRQIGPSKYWIIVTLPLLYFLSQFISIFSSNFGPSVYYDPVVFAIVLTLTFTLSKLAGGILFGFAFWSIARTIDDEFVVTKNLIKLAGYGYVILFMSTQTVAFSIIPFPPFGFVTILFYGLSCYMILVGIYFSVVIISQDSKLRSTIKNIAKSHPTLFDEMSYAQLENMIERRALRLVQNFAVEYESSHTMEAVDDKELRNYALGVIEEVKAFNPFYLKVLEKEKPLLANSNVASALVNGKLLQFMIDDHIMLFREIINKCKQGKHGGIRLITTVDTFTINTIKELLALGAEIKHMANPPSVQFVATDKEVLEISLGAVANGDNTMNVSLEHDSSLVQYYCTLFEQLWKRGTSASERISHLDTGS